MTKRLNASGRKSPIRPPRRRPVKSSSIISVGYDDGARTLDVEFEGGHVYRYFDVPASVHATLMAASSKGRFVNFHIRDAYRYRRLT